MWKQVGHELSDSMTAMLGRLANLLPGILGLVLALLISALVAWAVATILRRVLAAVDFDHVVVSRGFPVLADWSPSQSPTLLVAGAAASAIILVGFLIGLSAFDASLTSELTYRFVAYLPNVVAAVVVLIVGTLIARFLARSVLIGAVNMNLQYARLLSAGVKWLVTVLVVTMALEHLGLGGGIIRLAFGILFGGIVLALALAVGLGSKELVSRSLDREAVRSSSGQNFQEPVGHL